MNNIMYLSSNDLLFGMMIEKSDKFIENIITFEKNKKQDINDVISAFNLLKYSENYFKDRWAEDSLTKIKKICGRFINYINDDNFNSLYESLNGGNHEVFWEVFTKYKLYKKINKQNIEVILKEHRFTLSFLLKYSKIVEEYDSLLKKYFCLDSENTTILINEADIKSQNKIFLPSSLTKEDKNQLLLQYVNSKSPNLNFLRILLNSKLVSNFERTEKISKLINDRIQKISTDFFKGNQGLESKISVHFDEEQIETTKLDFSKDNSYKHSYSLKWFKKYMDYPTVLNNFIYIFKFVDMQMRILLVSKKSEIGVLEGVMGLKTETEYLTSISFDFKQTLSTIQLCMYDSFLRDNEIYLEEVIKWFFEVYLLEEFNIKNFKFCPTSNNLNYFDKLKLIFPEIESILKQYNLFVEDKEIDHELIQYLNPLLFEKCKSIHPKKYLYSDSEKIKIAQNLFFSNQCSLSFPQKYINKYDSFYNLLVNEKIYKNDYSEHTINRELNWLLEKKYIKIENDGQLNFNNHLQLILLNDLYNNQVINYLHYSKKLKKEADKLIDTEDLKSESTFFSKPESDYYNYILRSNFSNSMELRNKYLHGNESNSTNDRHFENYIISLKLIVLIIIKINDELSITIPQK